MHIPSLPIRDAMSMDVSNRFVFVLKGNLRSLFLIENYAPSCAVNQNESNDGDIRRIELDRFEPMTPVTDAK